MAVSKANQRAVNKCKKNNYDRIEITVPKGQRAVFQAHATAHGESVNGFINRAIQEAMERDSDTKVVKRGVSPGGGKGVAERYPLDGVAPGAGRQETGTAPTGRVVYRVPAADAAGRPQKAAETPAGAGLVYLPPDTLEVAQRASEAAGEALPDFVRRAVETQAQRDKASLRLGITPATGGKLDKEA